MEDYDLIRVSKINEVWNRVDTESGIAHELSDHLTFTVPGYKFTPAFKRGWDGKIRLFNVFNKNIYGGLLQKIQEFARVRGYEVEVDRSLLPNNFSIEEAREFANSVGLPGDIMAREHQLDGFVQCVRNNRALILSPTSSGKSLLIYLLAKWYGVKCLIIAPAINLVGQMRDDFVEYNADPELIHTVQAGASKTSDKPIWVSTWQSLTKMPTDWFDQFGMILVDEAHLADAKSIKGIMEKAENTPYRFGCTGTLDGSKTHELVLTGLFGPVKQVITTKEMIDKGYAAKLKIKVVVLKWGDEERQVHSKSDYQTEIDWIVTNERRNKFIKNLALSLDGNVLILFNFVEKQGDVLREMISSATTRKVNYIAGNVKGDVRNDIRKGIDAGDVDSITIASLGTTSTGFSAKNFNYLIFAHPSKGRIRNLQSIGRVLRMSHKKKSAELIDIADDLSWKRKKNHTLGHLKARLDQYDSEEHPYKIYPVDMSQ